MNMRIISILRFLLKPSWWPEINRRLKIIIATKFLPKHDITSRKIAQNWCQQNAIENNEFLEALGISHFEKIAEPYTRFYEYALKQEENDPYNSRKINKTGTGASADFLFTIARKINGCNFLETGVDRGWSSLALNLVAREKQGKVISIDTPKHKSKKGFSRTGIVVHPELRDNWELILKPDSVALRDLVKRNNNKFDFIHYDSDKSYWGRINSYFILFGLLKSGGVLVSDDVADNTAFRDFCFAIDRTPIITLADGVGNSKSRYIAMIIK